MMVTGAKYYRGQLVMYQEFDSMGMAGPAIDNLFNGEVGLLVEKRSFPSHVGEIMAYQVLNARGIAGWVWSHLVKEVR